MLNDDYLGAGVCCIYFHARSAAKSEGSDDADDDHSNDDGDDVDDDDDYVLKHVTHITLMESHSK